jgi:hypothetical protein
MQVYIMYEYRFIYDLKVHKHEIFLIFFLTWNKSLYALGQFSKNISILFLRFLPEFRCSNIFAVSEHTRNQIFLASYQKFFPQHFHFGPIKWVPRQFFKILVIYSQTLQFSLVFLSIFRKL